MAVGAVAGLNGNDQAEGANSTSAVEDWKNANGLEDLSDMTYAQWQSLIKYLRTEGFDGLVGESFRFGVYVPYISLEGPGVLVGGTVTRTGSNTVNKTSGIGDALATLSLDLLGNPAKVGVSVGSTLLLKLPTGDDKKGLGTGKVDYGFQLDLGYRPIATLGFTAVVGRQFYGESGVVSLLDGNYSSLGVNFAAGQSVLFNVSTAQRDALNRTSSKRKESAASVVVAVSPKLALQLALTQGNSVSSPDSVVSMSLLYQP